MIPDCLLTCKSGALKHGLKTIPDHFLVGWWGCAISPKSLPHWALLGLFSLAGSFLGSYYLFRGVCLLLWERGGWVAGSPGGSDGKESACSGFTPWVRKISWRRAWQCTPVFLPGEVHGQRSLLGRSPWGPKELDTAEWLTHWELRRGEKWENFLPLLSVRYPYLQFRHSYFFFFFLTISKEQAR